MIYPLSWQNLEWFQQIEKYGRGRPRPCNWRKFLIYNQDILELWKIDTAKISSYLIKNSRSYKVDPFLIVTLYITDSYPKRLPRDNLFVSVIIKATFYTWKL